MELGPVSLAAKAEEKLAEVEAEANQLSHEAAREAARADRAEERYREDSRLVSNQTLSEAARIGRTLGQLIESGLLHDDYRTDAALLASLSPEKAAA